jgi:hypothetical protein
MSNPHQVHLTASHLIKHAAAISDGLHAAKLNPKAAARALLLSEDTYATILLMLVLDHYGYAVLGKIDDDTWEDPWHPETIRMELEQDFSLALPKITLDKIMAAITLITTNFFFKDVRKFIDLCNILSGDDFSPDTFDPADAAEIMWGVSEALLIYPANNDPEDTEFSPEVCGYIEEVLKNEGIASAPDVLRLGSGADASDQVRDTFADDPEMFSAIWQTQQARSGELQQMVKDNLSEMILQLKVLPMTNGSKEGLLQSIQNVVGYLPAVS